MADAEWNYVLNGKSTGPVTLEQLRAALSSGQITPDALVWKAGMAQWTAARQVPGVLEIPVAVAPTLPATAPAIPTTGTTAPPVPAIPPPVGQPGALDSGTRTMAMLCHLLGVFIPIFGALVIWLVKREESPFIDDQGKEAVNFQITMIIASFACVPFFFFFCLGVPLLAAVNIFRIVLSIMACIKANNGIGYRYPLCLRLIK